jgi:hypothetical protein
VKKYIKCLYIKKYNYVPEHSFMSNLIQKKRDILQVVVPRLDDLYDKITSITTSKCVEDGLDILHNYCSSKRGRESLVHEYDTNKKINIVFDTVKECMTASVDRSLTTGTYLSQTYMDDTKIMYDELQDSLMHCTREFKLVDGQLLHAVIEELDLSNEPYGKYYSLLEIYEKNTMYSYDLLHAVSNEVLQYSLNHKDFEHVEIFKRLESLKDSLLQRTPATTYSFSGLNPHIKSFGIYPISDVMDLDTLADTVFVGHPPSSGQKTKYSRLRDRCKQAKYDLIAITKIVGRGIHYDISKLLDAEETKAYGQMISAGDGVSVPMIDRFRTIKYVGKKGNEWSIKYEHLLSSSNKFVLIIQEVIPDKFVIMSTERGNFFTRKEKVIKLVEFATSNEYTSTRINNYNKLVNKSILNNMFLNAAPDMKHLKVKSQEVDPNYMRNDVFIRLMNRFDELYHEHGCTSVYDLNKILKHDDLTNVFANVLIDSLDEFLSNVSTNTTEVYSSFLYSVQVYCRAFKKKKFDLFSEKVKKIDDKALFGTNKDRSVRMFVEGIMRETLAAVITNDGNVFQSAVYKILMLKLTLAN